MKHASMVDERARSTGDRRRAMPIVVGLALFASATLASAQVTSRVSVDSQGAEANASSGYATISRNGRFVVYKSSASNLVPNDVNGCSDVFVFDRNTGITECVSVDPSGATGNNLSGPWFSAVSDDGRFVAFVSGATNLVSGTTTFTTQVFLRDRLTGTTELITKDASGNEGDSSSNTVAMSPDGRLIAFDSYSSNLVTGDTNSNSDVFVYDQSTQVTERISVDSSGNEGNGDSFVPSMTPDGDVVAFMSEATNLVAADKNGAFDGFLRHRSTGSTERVTVDSAGNEANGDSEYVALSSDGEFVAFQSLADNLVSGDNNAAWDVFVRDLSSGAVEHISVDPAGAEGNDSSYIPWISDDGRVVAFSSAASNLVSGDTNGLPDAFLRDRTSGTTERTGVDSTGAEGNGYSFAGSISGDGLSAALSSSSSNLVANDTNGWDDVFVRDLHRADWSNYGAGFPGAFGIPSLTSLADPILGTTITVDVQNSLGAPTVGLLLVGTQQANLPTHFGGAVLVLPLVVAPITFSYGGDSFSESIPMDVTLAGAVIDVQAVESDPGAAYGVSFTAGLELTFGF